MATVVFSPIGNGQQWFTNAGVPLSGGKINTYAAGTTTPIATYTDNTGATPNANPIILDSTGRYAQEIWLDTTLLPYKFVVTDSSGATIGTYDNIPGVNGLTIFGATIDNSIIGGTIPAAGSFTSINGGQLAGLRNRIINGDMRIDQRNAGAAQTIVAVAPAAYTIDRFYAFCVGANVTGQQIAGSNADQFVYRFTGAASVTGIAFGQRIEATNIWDLNSTTVTLSAKLANSLLTTVTWAAYYPTATDNWSARTLISFGTFTVTSTLTKYQTTIALPAAVTAGLEIELSVGAQTSGTWTIGEVQVEAGSVATPFERIPYGLAETLCLRYLPAWNSSSTVNPLGISTVNVSTQTQAGVIFKVRTRVPPTGIVSSAASTFSGVGGAFSAIAFAFASVDAGILNFTTPASTPGQAGQFYMNNASAQLLFTGCEL